jgi:hypothetical protein
MTAPPPPIFQVGHLERVPLGTPYPGIVAHVGRLLTKLPGHSELVIDFTGVGRPVFDMFVYSGISPTGVLITGGTAETRNGPACTVPKLTLVSRLQALLHEGRLKIQRELDEAETLVRELQDFRIDFTAAGHLTFNARSGKHDDLVLALAIAVWRAYGGGMASYGVWELTRRQAMGSRTNEPRHFVGVDCSGAPKAQGLIAALWPQHNPSCRRSLHAAAPTEADFHWHRRIDGDPLPAVKLYLLDGRDPLSFLHSR